MAASALGTVLRGDESQGVIVVSWRVRGGVGVARAGSRLCHEGRGGADETDSALLRVSQAGGSGGADGGGIII